MSQQQPCRECGNTDYHQRDCSLSEWEETSNDTAVRDRDRVSRPTPEYTQEEEREAERLAIASGLGISEWPNFLSMARTNILRDGSVGPPTPEAEVSVSPATKHDPRCDCGICAYCNGQEDVYGNPSASPAIEEATPRPWRITCQDGDWVDFENELLKRSVRFQDAGLQDFVVRAVNAFDSHKAEIERLNSLHNTLCSELCRETQTETPIAAIAAIRSNAAKVERLEAALASVIRAWDYSKTSPSAASAISVIRAAVEPARAALIESPEKKNKS